MKRIRKYSVAVALGLMLVSCNKSQSTIEERVTLTPVIETKTTTDGKALTEFGIYLLANNAPYTSEIGKYTVEEGSNGELEPIAPIYCITRKNYNYLITSPYGDFVNPTSASCGGGVKVERSPIMPQYLSEVGKSIFVDGLHISNSNILHINQTLKQRLSKVKFKMVNTLEEDPDGYSIYSVKLINVLSKAIFCPVHTYHHANADKTAALESGEFIFTDGNGNNNFNVAQGKTVDLKYSNDNYFTFIANNYVDIVDTESVPVPILRIKFSNEQGKSVDVPIKINMKPQYLYTFTINLASTSIYIKVIANGEWSDEEYSDTGDVNVIDKYTININDDQWDDKEDLDITF